MRCPASAKEAEIEIESTSPEAETGRRVHAAMRKIVERDLTDGIPEVQEEDKRLVWNGLHIWKKIRLVSRTFAVEREIIDGELSGTPDYVGITAEGELIILDWKSGWADRDYSDQLKGYLWLARAHFLMPEHSIFSGGRIITAWLQTRDLYDVEIVTPEQLAAWEKKLEECLVSDIFAPGEHCLYCPGQWTCAARTAMVRQAVAIFGDQATDNLPVSPERLAAAYPAYQVATAALKRYHDLTKEAVEGAGSIALPDGRVLTLEPQEQRKILMSTTTLGILAKHFGADTPEDLLDEMPSVFKIVKEKLEQAIKERALKQKGAANVREVLTALNEAGVIEKSEVKKLVIKKGQADVDKK
jgi:hypothetical protein